MVVIVFIAEGVLEGGRHDLVADRQSIHGFAHCYILDLECAVRLKVSIETVGLLDHGCLDRVTCAVRVGLCPFAWHVLSCRRDDSYGLR